MKDSSNSYRSYVAILICVRFVTIIIKMMESELICLNLMFVSNTALKLKTKPSTSTSFSFLMGKKEKEQRKKKKRALLKKCDS